MQIAMKRFHHYMGGLVLLSALAFTACTPDDFREIEESGVPQASQFESTVDIQIDNGTNEVTFNLNVPGCMPYWHFPDQPHAPYSTVNGCKRVYTLAGTYTVEVRIMNVHGMSEDTLTKTFTIEKTLFDFEKYENFLTSGQIKQWVVAKEEAGYLGCGQSGTDGTGWWAARPNEQADKGIYDDVVTFGADGSFAYHPGEGGTMYVNKDCTQFEDFRGDNEGDFQVTIDEQSATWKYELQGTDLYLVLPAHTQFPYVPNDSFWENPRLKVLNMDDKSMEMVYDNGQIAWHYRLTTK